MAPDRKPKQGLWINGITVQAIAYAGVGDCNGGMLEIISIHDNEVPRAAMTDWWKQKTQWILQRLVLVRLATGFQSGKRSEGGINTRCIPCRQKLNRGKMIRATYYRVDRHSNTS